MNLNQYLKTFKYRAKHQEIRNNSVRGPIKRHVDYQFLLIIIFIFIPLMIILMNKRETKLYRFEIEQSPR